VNGEPHELPEGTTIADLLDRLGLAGRRVAVAIDREVVPRQGFAQRRLRAGDCVEILEAVGGG
jgi:sulfur carrier protein